MAKFVNSVVPFKMDGNKQYLTDYQVMCYPWLMQFINRFAGCFEHSLGTQRYYFYSDGVPSSDGESK